MTNVLPPVHPGEILREEYLVPFKLSAGALARKLHVPRTRIERLVAGQTPVTTDTALRLAKFLGTSAEFWMNMQAGYDLKIAAARKRRELARIKTQGRAQGRGRKAA
jgi:addiction module HigA family antidote